MKLEITDYLLSKHANFIYTLTEKAKDKFEYFKAVDVNGNEEIRKAIPDGLLENTERLKSYKAGELGIDRCYTYLHDPEKGQLIIAFRGTTSAEPFESFFDWCNNINQGFKSEGLQNEEGILLHTGYHNSVYNLRKAGLQDAVAEMVNNGVVKSVYITGHSKGGALATVYTWHLKRKFPNLEVKTVTFAAPKAGNEKFRNAYNTLHPHHTRYENLYDLVPQLPLANMGLGTARATAIKTLVPVAKVLFSDLEDQFGHVGKLHLLNSNYKMKSDFDEVTNESRHYKLAAIASVFKGVIDSKLRLKKLPGVCVGEHSMNVYIQALAHKQVQE